MVPDMVVQRIDIAPHCPDLLCTLSLPYKPDKKQQHEIRKNIATDLQMILAASLNSVKVFTNLA